MDKEITAVEAAELTGLSDRTIRRKIKEGILPARQIAPNRYGIKVSDLAKLTGQITRKNRTPGNTKTLLAALATRLETLETRVTTLETRPAAPQPGPRRLVPTRLVPINTEQVPVTSSILPEGSMTLADFARTTGLPASTLRAKALDGSIACVVLDQGSGPRYWLTPEQQEMLRPTGKLPALPGQVAITTDQADDIP